MQRLLLVSVMIAEKFLEDTNYPASCWRVPCHVAQRPMLTRQHRPLSNSTPHTTPRFFPPQNRVAHASHPPPTIHRADFGGIPLEELNALEIHFLLAIDFRLTVDPSDLARVAASLRAAQPPARRPRASFGRPASAPARGCLPAADYQWEGVAAALALASASVRVASAAAAALPPARSSMGLAG
jgi:hypothetical protein